jgi:hypothetical protein
MPTKHKISVSSISALREALSAEVMSRADGIVEVMGYGAADKISKTSRNKMTPEWETFARSEEERGVVVFVPGRDKKVADATRREEFMPGGTKPFLKTWSSLRSKAVMKKLLKDNGIK